MALPECTSKALGDIGHGVTAEVRFMDGVPGGVAYEHPTPTGARCQGYAPLQSPGETWDLVQLDPLTISPSLLCRGCGHHGFIREGKWVPA